MNLDANSHIQTEILTFTLARVNFATKYSNDIRNTWKVIKEVTNKTTTKTQLPELFKVDGKILTEKKDIANKLLHKHRSFACIKNFRNGK